MQPAGLRTGNENYGGRLWKSFLHASKGSGSRAVYAGSRFPHCRHLKSIGKGDLFTSGGTESNNWALIGTAMANQRRGKHLIITQVEHPAVSAPAAWLKDQGFEVTALSVDREGRISLEDLKKQSARIQSWYRPCMSIMKSAQWNRWRRSAAG